MGSRRMGGIMFWMLVGFGIAVVFPVIPDRFDRFLHTAMIVWLTPIVIATALLFLYALYFTFMVMIGMKDPP